MPAGSPSATTTGSRLSPNRPTGSRACSTSLSRPARACSADKSPSCSRSRGCKACLPRRATRDRGHCSTSTSRRHRTKGAAACCRRSCAAWPRSSSPGSSGTAGRAWRDDRSHHCAAERRSAAQRSTAQHSTAQHSTNSTTQNARQHAKAQHQRGQVRRLTGAGTRSCRKLRRPRPR
jgi:hypothetical protein